MRTFALALAGLFASGFAIAQPPKSPQPANTNPANAGLDPANNRLDQLLVQWEQRMNSVESLMCQCSREDKSKATGFVDSFKGEARFLKPNFGALRLLHIENNKRYELFVATGQYLYDFQPGQKTLYIRELPPQANAMQNSFLTFLFGMSAGDAKRRYELTLSKDVSPQNLHYVYIDIKPRFEEDKREFTRAQLVLFAQTMLPRRLWFEHPNGDQSTWEIPQIDTSVKLKPADFAAPDPPPDWQKKLVKLPDTQVKPAGMPRIVRPGSDK